MLGKLFESLSGKDDLERVAYKGDIAALSAYLKTRPVLVARRPKRFLDASNFTQEQLLELIEKESKDFVSDSFDPWVLEMNGKRRLPVFSSQKKLELFAEKLTKEMNKVFSLGGAEFLVDEIIGGLDLDFVDLNLFSGKSWEICVRKPSSS